MRQAEDRDNVLDKSDLIDLELLAANATRTTRRKVLIGIRMFKRSFEKTFSVKTAHFKPYLFAYINGLRIKGFVISKRSMSIGGSKLNDQFSLSLFENKIGQELFANIDKSVPLDDPLIYPALMGRVFLEDGSFVLLMTAIKIGKVIIQPFHQFFSRIRDIKNRSKGWSLVSIVFGRIDFVDAKRSFPVHYTSKIGQFKRIINDFIVRNYRHLTSKLCMHVPVQCLMNAN